MKARDTDALRIVLDLAGSPLWAPTQAQGTVFTLFHIFGNGLASLLLSSCFYLLL